MSTTNRYFVELGFDAASYEDPGATGSNTHALWLDGWRGLLIDGDHENETINLHRAFVTSSNVVALLRQLGTPLEPDYISIDVDSTDLYILERVLTTLRPRVVTIEYNSNFGDGDSSALAFPDTDWMPLGASKGAFAATCFYGSSASAIYAVATAAGYVVVGVVYGLDLVLVRASLWPHPGIPLANLTKRLDTWPAMSVEDAAALIDHSVYAAGGSLCAARRFHSSKSPWPLTGRPRYSSWVHAQNVASPASGVGSSFASSAAKRLGTISAAGSSAESSRQTPSASRSSSAGGGERGEEAMSSAVAGERIRMPRLPEAADGGLARRFDRRA